MAQIPNPFKLMDDFFLDYVFNPVTWKIEYEYGWNAMDVQIALTYIAISMFMLMTVILQAYLLFVLLLVIWMLRSSVGDNADRRRWHKTIKRGRTLVVSMSLLAEDLMML
jgi:heme/copper-type cytochrome/quinol oxidase subunit 2